MGYLYTEYLYKCMDCLWVGCSTAEGNSGCCMKEEDSISRCRDRIQCSMIRCRWWIGRALRKKPHL